MKCKVMIFAFSWTFDEILMTIPGFLPGPEVPTILFFFPFFSINISDEMKMVERS